MIICQEISAKILDNKMLIIYDQFIVPTPIPLKGGEILHFI